MDQRIINLYDQYTHSSINRKDFLKKLALLTGSTALALSVLPLLENNYAAAAMVNEDNLSTENITYKGVKGDMKGFLAKPKGKKNLGAVLVIHENRGLNPHTIAVTKRVAAEGFLALGVDALSPLGALLQMKIKQET